ncbi:PREDICTED: pentatricopeptide repeat-containing protein At4g31070, mitochondrial [Nelumbo nucifera]|uniref:Pentatricopeptide repeat-containing protein At4g31070, mitochondrial n=2 Tax=Nelumbo nucifera TaxID=4432 RepID=A0A1U7ZZY7_NELNU|nr:PREDICTED: pentatricopeptide repeat-containing protein At4g31070, mitochondrial [Nelumbo nucifera]DAD27731.1 TPA_asm: hypothetical protein HUJ06_029199 [Nelumbo nucifera]
MHQLIRRIHLLTQGERIKFSISNAGPTLSVSVTHARVRDLVSEGLFYQTLKFYKEEIHPSGLHGNASILPTIIKACACAESLHFGLQIHSIVIKTGSDSEPITANSLLSMYARCSNVESARQLFDTMLIRDTITWNSMITCYIRNGYHHEAIEVFRQMGLAGLEPKPELVAGILSVCARMGNLRLGRQIHASLVRGGTVKSSIFLSTALLDIYSKCFHLDVAFNVFHQMTERNEVSWTAMIAGCTSNENCNLSVEVFRAMQVEGVRQNRVTLLAVLPACAELGALKHGKEIHGYAIHQGFESEPHFEAALLDMYCKCGAAQGPGWLVFERSKGRDVVMWSSVIRAYSQIGNISRAVELFREMQMEGIKPNSVTLLAIIAACTTHLSTMHGREVHGYSLKSGLSFDIFVGNSLIDMYAKCGYLDDAHQIFREMDTKDSVSWSVLIRGYGFHGCGKKALELFHEMEQRSVVPDAVTLLAVLSACNHAGLIVEGQDLIDHVARHNNVPLTLEHYTCYIDLLARSGKIEEACEVLSHMPMKPSSTTVSCLASACRAHGRLDIAEMLAHQLIKLEPENAANYTLLCTVYAESSNWVGVEKIRRIMRIRGIRKGTGFSKIETGNGDSF